MTQVSTIAAIRFGYGLGPKSKPLNKTELLGGFAGADSIAKKFPVNSTKVVLQQVLAMRRAKKAANQKPADRERYDATRKALKNTAALGLLQATARVLDTDNAFFERLNWFWADHFTAVGKNLATRALAPAYLDEALRPHVAGRFADMLKAVITHPFMLTYLDQVSSFGPNSAIGKRRNKGLNENLARELLELHTLGVGAGYGQHDVRQLAELLTGLGLSKKQGFLFNPGISEPGTKTILGVQYGGEHPNLEDIFSALENLAAHPETAHHLARKLAVHFVSDQPDPDLIKHMTKAYLGSDGHLSAMYQAMLEHPAAWQSLGQKAKQPFDFILSILMAMGLTGQEFLNQKNKKLQKSVNNSLSAMGQPFMRAPGPDGWPEAANEWITPQGLANRITLSVRVSKFFRDRVTDPGDFLRATLADAAGERLIWAVSQTEDTREGITLVLASAEFNRR
ncbi:MAG: DUF1800 domain-containing protein [Paracoccaceae bacterium]